MTRRRAFQLAVAAVIGAVSFTRPAGAQNTELEPILFSLSKGGGGSSAGASSLQVFDVPLEVTVREPEGRPWGLRLKFPVSFGFYDLSAATVGDVLSRVQTVSVAPGLEFLVPVSRAWLLKPFAEAAFGTTMSGESTEVQYSAGVKARGEYGGGPWAFTVGLGAYYASPRATLVVVTDYTTLEAGLDARRLIGWRVAERDASAGVYAIGRWFPDLRLTSAGGRVLPVERVMEAGVRFSTAPEMAIWIIKFPWIAVGYRWGDMFQGYRISFDFPF